MTDATVNRLELLTEAVGRLVSEAKIKNAHDNELREAVERGMAALEHLARCVGYSQGGNEVLEVLPHRTVTDPNR